MAGPGAHPACDQMKNGGDSQGHPGLLQDNQLAIRADDIVAAYSDVTNNDADLDIDPQRDITKDLAIGDTLQRMNAELDEPDYPERSAGLGSEERSGGRRQDKNEESLDFAEGLGRLAEPSDHQDPPALKHENSATALNPAIPEPDTYAPVIPNERIIERITDTEELHRRDDELRDPRRERSKEPLCPVCLSPSNGSYHKACAPIELEDQFGSDRRGSELIGQMLNAESTKQEWDAFTKTLPLEDHHLASDKATKTERSELALKIAEFYALDLSEAWNVAEKLPHRGRHSDNYHAYVLGTMEAIMEETSDPEEFKRLFKERVTDPVRESPEVLRKDWWFRRTRRPKAHG